MIPSVNNQVIKTGSFRVPEVWHCHLPGDLEGLREVLDGVFAWRQTDLGNAELVFHKTTGLSPEQYILAVDTKVITVNYTEYCGAVWGLSTLIQLTRSGVIQSQLIDDQPDLPFRGYLLDISRDKLPKMATIKDLIDKLMILKINHLELYVEGFSLRLPAFPDLPYEDPLTFAEFAELQEYARKRGIDLAPNINTFGHMTKWLQLEKYSDLAESPGGFMLEGYPFPPSTLNPLDPRSQDLAKAIVGDLLQLSSSPYFNINGDEPFELGFGKSKDACLKESPGAIYLKQMLPLIDLVGEKATPLIWGDVIRNHPETIPELPKTTIIIDWGYDRDYDFGQLSAKLQGRMDFILAPGTSSWNSFVGRATDMKASIDNARKSASEYGALGMLLTDWGDFSHPQPLVVSYPAITYFASSAWSGSQDIASTLSQVDALLFGGKSGLTQTIIEMAGYVDLEPAYLHNRTMTFASWMYVDKNPLHPLAFKHKVWEQALRRLPIDETHAGKIIGLADRSLAKLKDDSLETREIRQAIRLVKAAVLLNRIASDESCDVKAARDLLVEIDHDYAGLWRERNRNPGLSESKNTIELLLAFLDNFYLV